MMADESSHAGQAGRPMVASLGVLGSVVAFFAGLCCFLPMIFLIAGLGGAWIAIFGKVAAIVYFALCSSLVLVAIGWFIAIRRGSAPAMRKKLILASVLTVLAAVLVFNETALNDYLITFM
ncbi:hypothetical protein HPQ64_16215 [Rhizobiales bacterium]|uniref:hypothetical protein n=1 Tax=Hongsoonwoonella zoysiae TaxID=2821844 RepID=UPI0015607A52|nr:hypothetical protein [Hongsoonwoonella zoysiae]NRG19236.1 hypothetical protein [Hongsoonwoonella zoysiae]